MNTTKDERFQYFKEDVSYIETPECFTFPFYYEPHPLSVKAAQQLQIELSNNQNWNHDFGVTPSNKVNSGKMFGVLVVKNASDKIGFLKGYSGKLANTPCPSDFVPHVIDSIPTKPQVDQGIQRVNEITKRLKIIENHPDFHSKKSDLETLKHTAKKDIEGIQKTLSLARAERKRIRSEKKKVLSSDEFEALNTHLAKRSVQKKFYLKQVKENWESKILRATESTQLFYREYEQLREERKDLSLYLQKEIFKQYELFNALKEPENLLNIFNKQGISLPPSGAGDCAAPKLLQHAYQMGYTPLCMAEFWWGKSPDSEIKVHQNFYPACTGKCQPILNHMLKGLEVDANPMENNPGKDLEIQILMDDEDFLVINKPSGLLSVPGKLVNDSVATRIREKYPDATGPLIVHRLDMPTSGIMVLAKNEKSHENLQKQFIKRTISKRYIAVLNGEIDKKEGIIDLPLRVDLNNRPFQLVCYDHGKSARTKFEVIEVKDNQTRIHFYPITGRTHQLRVHSAHHLGLGTPIVGDSLYGQKSNRLSLHAETLTFTHPKSGELLTFQVDSEF